MMAFNWTNKGNKSGICKEYVCRIKCAIFCWCFIDIPVLCSIVLLSIHEIFDVDLTFLNLYSFTLSEQNYFYKVYNFKAEIRALPWTSCMKINPFTNEIKTCYIIRKEEQQKLVMSDIS